MLVLKVDNPLALAVVDAIHAGDITALNRLLGENLDLASARIDDGHSSRSLLHVVTDWPGHFPRDSESVATLVAAGADVNARFRGSHTETPCIGPQAAMTSRPWMLCSMLVPISTRLGA